MTTSPGLDELYPPLGLRIRAGDLTLRPFTDADLPAYAELLREPIFEDAGADYVFPWYAAEPEHRVREALRFQWRARATIAPEEWTVIFGIWVQDRLIGTQDVGATDFAARRVVGSGSWLTLAEHGKGYGTLMRQAMLVLAFDHLGARRAESSAALDNERSHRVSRACGYVDNGTEVTTMPGGETPLTLQRFLATPETFRRPAVPVTVDGLTDRLRGMLGA